MTDKIDPNKNYKLGEVWKQGWIPFKSYATVLKYYDGGIMTKYPSRIGEKKIRWINGQDLINFLDGTFLGGESEIRTKKSKGQNVENC